MRENWQADQPSYHLGPEQGFELAHPSIHLFYELQEHVKGPRPTDPKLQALYDIAQQQRSSNEGPVSTV